MLFFHQSITRLRAPVTTDRYRNATRDWDNAERRRITGLSVVPLGSSEPRSGEGPGERDQTVTGWKVQSPPGVDLDLRSDDRVELDDNGSVLCEVVGEVARFPDPWGRGVHHVEANVERVNG